ncbi:transcriptional regulator [Bacillus sp. 3255]|uniref:transcriptional regulator n=1 Tax=Bacillus sp. 3255 TaxID=2817904 RepID=UPI002859C33F|nr:transcriptional regulator [Bacillus sp. 3255]MDR6882076.1 hypothetical protein [Bacillus sp. 3255]
MKFERAFDIFMASQLASERNARRRERLEGGLGHGETEFLRKVWYPAIGSFDHLYPEWEVRDFSNGYRYLDFAYMPGGAKAAIEIQGYATHARDIEHWRFKDLCMRHCHLGLDGWLVMPLAYPAIAETPKQCQQLMLALVGKFVSYSNSDAMNWVELETVRFARRLLRPFSPSELAEHLRVSPRHARNLLRSLCDKQILMVSSGQQRARLYSLITPHQ